MSAREDRCPPVPLWLQKLIPKGSFAMFTLAATEGRGKNPRGTFDDLLRGERPIGIRVSAVHRDRVLEHLNVGPRRWQQARQEWVRIGFVHPCQNERLFITLRRFVDICPDCGTNWGFVASEAAVRSQRSESSANTYETGNPSTGTQRGESLSPSEVERLKKKYSSKSPSEKSPLAIENEVAG
jgi:hypothetical protein